MFNHVLVRTLVISSLNGKTIRISRKYSFLIKYSITLVYENILPTIDSRLLRFPGRPFVVVDLFRFKTKSSPEKLPAAFVFALPTVFALPAAFALSVGLFPWPGSSNLVGTSGMLSSSFKLCIFDGSRLALHRRGLFSVSRYSKHRLYVDRVKLFHVFRIEHEQTRVTS